MCDNARCWSFTVLAMVVLGLIAPIAVNAELPMPAQQQQGDITFMTGGIAEEAEMMRGVAKDYALEVVLIQKLGEQEEFLADVEVQVLDTQKNVVLETVTEGPYLFANLPAGRYWVVAKFKEDIKQQKALISTNKHQKVVLWWPITEPPQPEDESE